MSADPFVVSVPEGATEIDLRPVLVPLVRKLMLAFEKGGAFSDKAVEEWVADVRRDHWRAQLAERLDWRWVKRYLLDTDWRRSCGSSGYHQYYPNEGEHHFYKPYVCIVMQEEYNDSANLVDMCRKAVEGIAKWEDRTFEQVCASILAHVSAIDALASLSLNGG